MKFNPYEKILDLEKERKEYNRLQRNKSTYNGFSEWKEHILKRLGEIHDPVRLEDYKYFLMVRQRSALWGEKTHFNIVIPFLTVISSTLLALLINVIFLFINLNITSYSNIFNWIILPTFLLMCFVSLGISFKSFRKKNFYDDILKIVKECQNSLDEYFLANFKSDAKRMQNMKLVVKITSNKSLSRSKRLGENRKLYTKNGHRKQ